jgi:thiol-disulfide isomerase/thioredoxin
MKKIIVPMLLVTSMIVLTGCSLTQEKEDAMKLEGMMPKEDNKMIDAMMRKTEGEDAMMKKDTSSDNQWESMEKMDGAMMKDDSAMMKQDVMVVAGSYTAYSPSAVTTALAAKKNVILFFHATWCPTCKAADATFKKETPPANTVVFKVDYDTNKDLRSKYGVTYQHTFVSLNADETLKKKSSGKKNFAELAELN